MKSIGIRTISGIVFLVMITAGIFAKALFPFVFGFSIAVMIHEYFQMAVGKSFPLEKTLVQISAVSLFLLLYFVKMNLIQPEMLMLSLVPLFIAFATLLWTSVSNCDADDEKNTKIEHLFFPMLYIAVPVSSSVFLEFSKQGFTPVFLIYLFILIWVNDIGAYAFGMGFGQRPGSLKIAPKLSPKKSWWGFWGGCIASVSASVLIGLFLLKEIPIIHIIAVGVIVGVFSIFGDLFESLIKRRSSVKDSGKIMPGHGGLLDRFDSMLIVMPLVVIYLKICGIV